MLFSERASERATRILHLQSRLRSERARHHFKFSSARLSRKSVERPCSPPLRRLSSSSRFSTFADAAASVAGAVAKWPWGTCNCNRSQDVRKAQAEGALGPCGVQADGPPALDMQVPCGRFPPWGEGIDRPAFLVEETTARTRQVPMNIEVSVAFEILGIEPYLLYVLSL